MEKKILTIHFIPAGFLQGCANKNHRHACTFLQRQRFWSKGTRSRLLWKERFERCSNAGFASAKNSV